MRFKLSERGAASMEAALVIPTFLIVGLVIITLISRSQTAVSLAEASSQEAARAASQQSSESGAYRAAQQIVVDNNKSSKKIVCNLNSFSADLDPGGLVEVTVTCEGSSSPFPGFASQRISKSRTAVESVDLFRSQS